MGQDSQGLGAGGILGTAGHVAFAGGDHGGHAAMEGAVDKAVGFLAGAVVADCSMDMGIKETGSNGSAAGIDNFGVLGVFGQFFTADRGNEIVLDDDGIALDDGIRDITAGNGADVGYD